MVIMRQCPFCLREFNSIEEVTRHLVFSNCQLQDRDLDEQEPDIAALRGHETERGQEEEHPEA